MIYNLKISEDHEAARAYFDKLYLAGDSVEIKKITKRSNNQNRYLHALFTFFGGKWGWDTEEAKIIVKRALGYTYEKNGTTFLVKTRKMTVPELTEFIDKFRNYSAHQGFYLPTAQEFDENYVKMMKEVAAIESQMKQYV